MITHDENGKEEEISFEDYAARWGCDPCYDRAPRLPGDGYQFYNFGVEGNDKVFLKKFLPAIERTILEVKQRTPEPHEVKERLWDIEELEELRDEVARRLKNVDHAKTHRSNGKRTGKGR